MDLEAWRPIPGYEGIYEVSSLGRVRSCERDIRMKNGVPRHIQPKLKQPTLRSDGYLDVQLWSNNEVKSWVVHRLVALAFIPNPDNLPMINHIDCDRTNNCVNNLEWTTASGNLLHAKKLGRLPDNRNWLNNIRLMSNEVNRKPCKCVETGEVFPSQAEAARRTGIDQVDIMYSIKEGRPTFGLTFIRIPKY